MKPLNHQPHDSAIDERKILEFAGYECLEYPDDPDERFRLIVYKDKARTVRPNIHDLNWQAKSLWPKFDGFKLYKHREKGVIYYTCHNVSCEGTDKDPATAILKAAMVLRNKEASDGTGG